MVQYSIRFSNRAKYLRLSVSKKKGVEVVVPAHVGKRQAQQLAARFVQDKKAWLEKTLKRLKYSQLKATPRVIELPKQLHLKAIEKVIAMEYLDKGDKRFQLQPVRNHYDNSERLIICGDVNQPEMILEGLRNYLKPLAKDILSKRLDFFCQKHGLTYQRLTIRAQKTRWGSCSSKKNINLNFKLLFIEPHLADYVLLHELAHTRFLNHSVDFWTFLQQLCPDCKVRDRELNRIAKELPVWLNS